MSRVFLAGVCFVTLSCAAGSVLGPVPPGLDRYVPVPDSHPLTVKNVTLGQRLFGDKRLSADGSLACASCHVPDRAFTQARPIAIGVHGRAGKRNAPTLINRAWGQSFFWDGRTSSLEEQVVRPIEDPLEMGSSVPEAARRTGLTERQLTVALASYVRSIQSGGSPFDRYNAGDVTALPSDARAGLDLFRSKARCVLCHTGPLLSDERFHNTGIAWRSDAGVPELQDLGRFLVTGRHQDRGAFKTPTLREVAHTAPYMHDGSIGTLEEVIDFYDRGGRPNATMDVMIQPIGLTAVEKQSLVAFIRSLSGTVVEGPQTSVKTPAKIR